MIKKRLLLVVLPLVFAQTGATQPDQKAVQEVDKRAEVNAGNNAEPSVKDEQAGPVSDERSGRQAVFESALYFADWIDRFFGEREELETASYDYLRLVNNLGWREGEGFEYRPRIKAKVHFPKINRKFSLLIADDNDVTGNRFDTNQNDEVFINNEKANTTAAINYDSDEYQGSQFSTRIGLDSSLRSFALLKHNMSLYQDENLQLRNINYLFWKDEQGFGLNPRFELDRVINEKNLFRWQYSVLRAEKSEGNEWFNRFSWIERRGENSWLSYDMDISGASERDYTVETYRLALRYRKQLSIKWLYLEVEPELLWQKSIERPQRHFIPGLILRLEIQLEE